MKTLSVAFCLLLSTAAIAQRPVEPARVTLSLAERKLSDREFNDRLRAELNKYRHVAITSRRVDFEITTVTQPITSQGRVIGYAVAVLVVESERDGRRRFRLSIETAPTLPAAARNVATYLDREFFAKRRAQKD